MKSLYIYVYITFLIPKKKPETFTLFVFKMPTIYSSPKGHEHLIINLVGNSRFRRVIVAYLTCTFLYVFNLKEPKTDHEAIVFLWILWDFFSVEHFSSWLRSTDIKKFRMVACLKEFESLEIRKEMFNPIAHGKLHSLWDQRFKSPNVESYWAPDMKGFMIVEILSRIIECLEGSLSEKTLDKSRFINAYTINYLTVN